MSKPFIVGYARCSTEKQDLEIQIEALKAAGAGRVFQEKLSGAKENRPELRAALDSLRTGDVFMVYRTDRLARSVRQTVNIVHEIGEKGAQFKSLMEGYDTTSPSGEMLFHMIASFAQMERRMIQSRVREGVAKAQAQGVKFGRKSASDMGSDLAPRLALALQRVREGASVARAAKETKLSRTTVTKYLNAQKVQGVVIFEQAKKTTGLVDRKTAKAG